MIEIYLSFIKYMITINLIVLCVPISRIFNVRISVLHTNCYVQVKTFLHTANFHFHGEPPF